jgi:hypothetical protein
MVARPAAIVDCWPSRSYSRETIGKKEITEGKDIRIVWYYSEGISKSFAHRAFVFDKSHRAIHKIAVDIRD